MKMQIISGRIDETDDSFGLQISQLYTGVRLRANHVEKQMIVCERDGELLYRTTTDGGKTWTEFREI